MEPSVFSLFFAGALLLSTFVKFWLASRQMRHVVRHRDRVPSAFEKIVSLKAHQKAADYTVAKNRLGLLSTACGATVVLGWTLLGGLDALNGELREEVLPRYGALAYQVALIATSLLIGSLLDVPLGLYTTFRIEQRFGFNRMSCKLYVSDMFKSFLLGLLIGLPIIALIVWIMGRTGSWWWLWAWSFWGTLNLVAMVIYPVWISPLYNKFSPLQDEAVKRRAQALMERCGFTAKGFFVMDGSRRSGHGNAYFTGLGSAKRVVFFDTLLARLNPVEVEAVLAHELGHFKHKHLLKRLGSTFAASLAGFALLGWLSTQSWFYVALGTPPSLQGDNEALALLLFLLVIPVFSFFVSPLLAYWSREHEFEADAFARCQTRGENLAAALLKLHENNAATLTPDPWYVWFYYSHPPASERIAALKLASASR